VNKATKYKKDYQELVTMGERLLSELQDFCDPESPKYDPPYNYEGRREIPIFFLKNYEMWYSEALILIGQLMEERYNDFKSYYKYPEKRRSIHRHCYRISDLLQGIHSDNPSFIQHALMSLIQQISILKSIEKSFDSLLFDIKYLVQADVLDTEIDVAKELNRHGFLRAAGAVAGVALEAHLKELCARKNINIKKKKPTIGDFNNTLKENGYLDTPTWRNIQRLSDLRNKCTHKGDKDPTKDDVQELIEGVEKYIKNLY